MWGQVAAGIATEGDAKLGNIVIGRICELVTNFRGDIK
jgi:hypothetical protein